MCAQDLTAIQFRPPSLVVTIPKPFQDDKSCQVDRFSSPSVGVFSGISGSRLDSRRDRFYSIGTRIARVLTSPSTESNPLISLVLGGTSMKVKPIHDRILVKRVEEKETVKGGIIIPD